MRQSIDQQQQRVVREGTDRGEQLDDVAAGRSEEAALARGNVARAVMDAYGIDMRIFDEENAGAFEAAVTEEGLRPNAAADAAAAGQAIAKGSVELAA